jgi:transforming growth factor-beta-induced protein
VPTEPPTEATPTAPPTPPELKGLIPTVEHLSNLSTLLALADLAQLLDEAKVGGPYTILAPDNEAFAKLPADQLEQLKANPTLLRQVVLHHVISDAGLSVADLVERATPTPLFGPGLKITKEADAVRVDGAQILQAGIEFDRGVIHVIDQVLITPDVVSAIEESKKQ